MGLKELTNREQLDINGGKNLPEYLMYGIGYIARKLHENSPQGVNSHIWGC